MAGTAIGYGMGHGSPPPPGVRGYMPVSMLAPIERVREVSAATIEYFAKVVDDPERITKHRIAAGRAILAHHQWREDWEDKRSPETLFLAMFGNDPAKAAAWLDANEGRIRARLQQGSVATSAAEDSSDAEAEQGREGEGDEGR